MGEHAVHMPVQAFTRLNGRGADGAALHAAALAAASFLRATATPPRNTALTQAFFKVVHRLKPSKNSMKVSGAPYSATKMLQPAHS